MNEIDAYYSIRDYLDDVVHKNDSYALYSHLIDCLELLNPETHEALGVGE